MRSKRLLATFLALCLLVSSIPVFTLGVSAETASADGSLSVMTVECTSNDQSLSKNVKNETANISTSNGSMAVFNIDFGSGTYSSAQIYYSGRSTDNRCPADANVNVWLGDRANDPDNAVLLGNIKVPPHGSDWSRYNLSSVASLSQGLTGQQIVTLEFVGREGYSTVANARSVYFMEGAPAADITEYVDVPTALASGYKSGTDEVEVKDAANGEGPGKLFDGYTESKMGLPKDEGKDVTITFQTKYPLNVAYYTYLTANDSPDRDPKAWKLYGSNDGANYTEIDSVSGFSAVSTRFAFCGQYFQVDAPAEYTYFKLVISECKGSGYQYCQFDELRLYGSVGLDSDKIDSVMAAIDAIGDTEIFSESYFTAVQNARTSYDALNATEAGYVTNYAVLTSFEEYTELYNELGADAAKVIYAIDQIGDVTYKSKVAISDAKAAFDALDLETQTKVTEYYGKDILSEKQSAYDEIIADFGVTFTLNKDRMTATNQPWIALQSDDEWNATLAAMADTVKYFYSERMINIGVVSGRTGSTENHDGVVGAQLDNKFTDIGKDGPNDNCWNPWSQGGRYWSYLIVPFSGMAFDVGGYMVVNDNHKAAPLGEEFDAPDGRTYQVMWNKTISYVTVPRENGKIVTVDSVSLYPGSGDYADTIGNAFRYMYADYAQSNKWDGLTLGYPTANAASSGNTYYQAFTGPQGSAYLLTTSDILGTVALATTDAGYEAQLAAAANSAYTITGKMAEVIDDLGGIDAFVAYAGAPVSKTYDAITFENGTLRADGYTADNEEALEAAIQKAIDDIAAIGEVVLSYESLAKIETAEASYAAVIASARDRVTNSDVLTAARTRYDALKAAIVKIDNASRVTPISGPKAGENEGFEKLFDSDSGTKLYQKETEVIVEWKTDGKTDIFAYSFTTGNDTGTNPTRNPKNWILYGSNDGENYTEITSVAGCTVLPKANQTEYVFYLDTPVSYEYFKIDIDLSAQDTENGEHKFQLSEISLYEAPANAKAFNRQVEAIAPVTLESGDALSAADAAYAALNDTEQYFALNKALLESMKETYANLNTPADYSAVNAAKSAAEENIAPFKGIYTAESYAALEAALDAVTEGLDKTQQDVVDAYAKAIADAVDALKLNLEIIITDGVSAPGDNGKVNVTWNANVVLTGGTTIDDINSSNVKFTDYGVVYGVSEQDIADNTANCRTLSFANGGGDDIDVYTIFGFRLKNVAEGRSRCAQFYINYTVNGVNYTVYSDFDTALASLS